MSQKLNQNQPEKSGKENQDTMPSTASISKKEMVEGIKFLEGKLTQVPEKLDQLQEKTTKDLSLQKCL